MHRDNVEDLLDDAAADFVGDPLRCLDVVVHVDAGEHAVPNQVGSTNGTIGIWQSWISGEHVAQLSTSCCTSIARVLCSEFLNLGVMKLAGYSLFSATEPTLDSWTFDFADLL